MADLEVALTIPDGIVQEVLDTLGPEPDPEFPDGLTQGQRSKTAIINWIKTKVEIRRSKLANAARDNSDVTIT